MVAGSAPPAVSSTSQVARDIGLDEVTLSVVIPALNEERGIADIIERVERAGADLTGIGISRLEIIVVDDGSSDHTAEVASGFQSVRVVSHGRNRGYGAAIKTGFGHAQGGLLAFLDADGTYPPERLTALCKVALDEEVDIVVGSRRSGADSEMPFLRRVGNVLWATLVSAVGNHRVADPASGMRILDRSALPRLYPLPDGLNFTPVMSVRAVHEGLRVVEVPIPYRERVGRSKLSIIGDGTRFLKTILWTSLEYNPVRILGFVGLACLSVAAAIGLVIVGMRLQGITQLGVPASFAVFAAMVLAVAGVSVFSMGASFTYLVSLFHGHPVRQGLFGRPLFDPPLDHHFGLLGLVTGAIGIALAACSLALAGWGAWDIARLWLWLLASAMLILVGLQLAISWVVARVLEGLSAREMRTRGEMRPDSAAVWDTK